MQLCMKYNFVINHCDSTFGGWFPATSAYQRNSAQIALYLMDSSDNNTLFP